MEAGQKAELAALAAQNVPAESTSLSYAANSASASAGTTALRSQKRLTDKVQ